MYDVAVVGGGPAGSAVAIHLVRAGARVVVLERADSPGRKSCGEGLFPAGAAELERLGLAALVRDSPALTGIRFSCGKAAARAAFSSGRPARGVRRTALDPALLERAACEGAEVRERVTVESFVAEGGLVRALQTGAGRVEARAFVAADGLRSRFRRLAGLDAGPLRSRYGVSAHVGLPAGFPEEVWVSFHPGYEVYVTPVGAGLANVAILAWAGSMSRFAGDLAGGFLEAARGHAALGPALDLEGAPLAAGPFPARSRRSWRANLVLAGDAAGFYDGISGEGISLALRTAGDCAAAVLEYLDGGRFEGFRRYDSRRRHAARNSELLARLTLLLARDMRVARRAIRGLAGRPETFAKLVAINAGGLGLGALRPADLAVLTGALRTGRE